MKKSAIMYIVCAGLLWGTSGIFVHYLAPFGLSSIQMTAIRGTVSLVAIGLYLLLMGRSLFSLKGRHLPLCATAGVSMFLTATFYYMSMQLTSVSTSVILMYTAPVFVMWYSVGFLGEKITPMKLISVLFVLVGCALVSGVVGGMKYNLWGIILGFLSGITYSIYNIVTKIEMKKKIQPLTATFYCYVFMAATALLSSSPGQIITIAQNNPWWLILIMIGLGIFTSVTPYFLYTLGLKNLPAGTASSLGVMEPLAATLYSVLLFDEALSLFSLLGMILILCAVVMLSREK